MAAATQFFDTVELIEATLLHLRPRELLLSQRTCRSFRGTVQGSAKLLQALFMRAGPSPQHDIFAVSTISDDLDDSDDSDEPDEADSIKLRNERSVLWKSSSSTEVPKVRQNTFIPLLFEQYDVIHEGVLHRLKSSDEIVMRPEASWRMMHVTSAPETEAFYSVSYIGTDDSEVCEYNKKIKLEVVVKLGDIVESVLAGGTGFRYVYVKIGWVRRPVCGHVHGSWASRLRSERREKAREKEELEKEEHEEQKEALRDRSVSPPYAQPPVKLPAYFSTSAEELKNTVVYQQWLASRR